MEIKTCMDKIWDFFENKMLCKETNLIYDYRTSLDEDGLIKDLPIDEEVEKQIPNPCGWGTGMEDSMLNNPLMLDAVVYRYEVTKDEKLHELADRLLSGIKLCATISEDRGFLARSVSPFAKKNYYINSSRDQYTHCIYGLFHYLTSSMMKDEHRAWITDVLVSFAERAEKNITAENEYDYLRADGKRGLVCNMWGPTLYSHETNRIHMIYLAAWYASRDAHWYKKYKEIRDVGIQRATERFLPKTCMYGFLQMQVSIKLLHDAEPDDEYKKKYEDILKLVVDKVKDYRIDEGSLDYENINSSFESWRDQPGKNMWSNFIPRTKTSTAIEGYQYYVPTTEHWSYVLPIRDITEAVYIRLLGGDKNISKEQLADFNKVLEYFDYDKHCSYAYICALVAYWAGKHFEVEI